MSSEPDFAFFSIPPSEVFRDAALARQRTLTKPDGSLGRLEELAVQLASLGPDGAAASRPAAAILFVSDHPVAAHGVSAFPAEVTAAMTANFLRGGAAAAVAAASLDVSLSIVDVGVAARYPVESRAPHISFRRDEVANFPVGDLTIADALPSPTLAASIRAGRRAVAELPARTRVVVLGEMGIGNTTVAAAVAGALLGCSADAIAGPGTGVAGEVLARKRNVVAQGLARVRPGAGPAEVLLAVGGREIAALVGAAGEAAARGMVILVDGFIVSAAMLALVRWCPAARARLVFSHQSREPGHALVLSALDARPLLDLDLRLGEASGAFAALPLLDLACALHHGMATFEDAGVPGKSSA